MPTPSTRRRNTGKRWTPEDDALFRRLLEDGVSLDLVIDRLGRSRGSVLSRATLLGFRLGRVIPGGAWTGEGAQGPFRSRPTQPFGHALAAAPHLRVRREGSGPLPWTWEIVWDDETAPWPRAQRGYRSAEEAWEAGRFTLAGMKRGGPAT